MKRTLYFDILNICACFAVICLHCNGIAHTYTPTLAWKQAFLVECVMYWAVPIFFMLSGATLMGYRDKYSTKEFFKKRLLKTLIPFVVWSILVAIRKGMPVGDWGLRTWFNMIFMNRIENVYWFFFPLFAVYLCIPVLTLLAEEKHRKILWYMVAVGFVTYSVLPVLMPLLGLEFNGHLGFPLTGGYVLFVILGYLISTEHISKKNRIIIYLLAIFGLVFRFAFTWYFSARDGAIDKRCFGYLQFHSVFLAVGVFVLFKAIPWGKLFREERSCRVLAKISSCSFGIYLMHMTTYWGLSGVLGINTACWQWRIFAPLGIYTLSLLAVLVLKHIPIVKNIVP